MNIWYLHHYATPGTIAGLHRPFEFGTHFIKNGNKMTVFTSSYLHYVDSNMIDDKQKYKEEIYDDINAVFVKTCGYKNSGLKRVLNMFQFAYRLFGVSKNYVKNHEKPDVIIASSPHPFTMISGILIARKYKVPCICEVRDFWPEVFFLGGRLKEKSLIGKMLLIGERWIYEKCDSLVFLKEGDYTYILDHKWDKKNGGKIDMEKCHYVNNGVNIEEFNKRIKNCFQDDDLEDEAVKVIYCGTIRPINDVGLLLDAAKNLPQNVKVLIYGTGNCVDELQKRIENEKINNVKLNGFVENKYIPYILSKSTINILNYSAKGYNWSRGNSSNKLFEYLASGKPVVSTIKMGYDIVEKYNCGYSAEECTGIGISNAINKIVDLNGEEYQKLCDNAKYAASMFDIAKLSNDYMNIIKITKQKYDNCRRKCN